MIMDNAENIPATGGAASGTVTETGTGAAPATEFEKIDPSKLSPEELRHYKFFQGHYTKATQKHAEKEKELTGKVSSLESLVGDDLIKPLAYYRQYGKLPDGMDSAGFYKQLGAIIPQSAPQTVTGTEGAPAPYDPNSVYVDENTQKYLDHLFETKLKPLQEKLNQAESFVNQEVGKKANDSVVAFKGELVKNDPKLGELFDKFVNSGELKEAIANTPFNPDFNKRLAFAFNGLMSSEYIPYLKEKERNKVLEELKNKDNTERPITSGTAGGAATVHPTDLKAIIAEAIDNEMG